MTDRLRASEDAVVLKALHASYVPEVILDARARQDRILTERFVGKARRIADIGCGTGYHGSMFAPWAEVYHGFEISPEIAQLARERWQKEGLANAEVIVGDVGKAELQRDFYDLVLCMYFTPGNFREKSEDLGIYDDAYLDANPAFTGVFTRFHAAMSGGASMLLVVYKDTPDAEAAQIDFYEQTGATVITSPGSRFVATAENFWSVRWTGESMRSNLRACGIRDDEIVFHDLNPISWLVEVRK